jgi:cytochrome b6-f complex iron-sulfur subunit
MEFEKTPIKRRRFLDMVIGGAFFTTIMAAFGTAIAFILPPKRTNGGGESRTEVGTLEQLPVGKAIKTLHQGKPIVVGNTKRGYFALSAVCTHLGCLVDWNEKTQQLDCPCHAAKFDTQGNILSGPAPKPLPSYETVVAGGKIYVT